MESKTVTLTAPAATTSEGAADQRLQAVFGRRADRFAHSIRILNGETNDEWLQSIEGDESAMWPVSPPFQQALEQREGTAHVIFLVGMAGHGHWSASVEAFSAGADTPGGLLFDVACRCPQRPPELGSGYQPAERYSIHGPRQDSSNVEADDRRENSLQWALNEQLSMRVRAVSLEGTPSCRIRMESNQLRITPHPTAEFPATVRWKYALELIRQ